MMDALAIEAIVAATGLDWPLDAGAALLVDVDGPAAETSHTAGLAAGSCAACGAPSRFEPARRARTGMMWTGARRVRCRSADQSELLVQNGVIPRSGDRSRLARDRGAGDTPRPACLRNVFHAGDGNLQPLVLYDAHVTEQQHRAETVGAEILRICLRYGGSITGERGVQAD